MYKYTQDEDAPLHQWKSTTLEQLPMMVQVHPWAGIPRSLTRNCQRFSASVPALIGAAFGGPPSLAGTKRGDSRSTPSPSLSFHAF